MRRKPGRPRTAMMQMDALLFGQLKAIVLDMDAEGVPWNHMARVLTERTGVTVHPSTIRGWAREFREEVSHA